MSIRKSMQKFFVTPAKKASEMDLPGVAEELKGAAEAGKKVSEHLRSATEKRENPGKYTSSD